jgi:GT2 family glycosyltransferase
LSPPSAAVGIVNFNTRDHLAACLESVLAESPAEVVVVDNASQDGSVDLMRSKYPRVTLHANADNRGYGAAANQAIASCGTPYVLVLNADTRLVPGALAALVAHLERHPEAAVVGPLLRRLDGTVEPSYFPFPGSLKWLLENEPLAWALPHLPVGREQFLRLTAPTTDRVVPWVKGAALLIRRSAFEEVGGFDEVYFMYFEEVDLCFRLHARRREVHFTPAATVVHVGGASTSQVREAMLVAHFRSNLLFYRRHCSPPARLFWTSAMRLKMLLRVVRDRARLARESDPGGRDRLRQQIAAWRTALRGTGVSLAGGRGRPPRPARRPPG